MKRGKEVSKEYVEELFRDISSQKYGKRIDFNPLIDELSKLKNGGALTFSHLEKIADPDIWPFENYWRWPTKEQIEDDLKKTNNLFKNLPKNEEHVIEILYDIFKNLELASIILRFVDPENFGIYSPPVAKILHLRRGKNYVHEYQNYLAALRDWRNVYRLDRVDYVDMFLWALEEVHEPNKAVRALHHTFSEKNINNTLTAEFIEDIKNKSNFEKAKLYFKVGEYQTAALWAGVVFIDFVKEETENSGFSRKHEDGRWKTNKELIIDLTKTKKYRNKWGVLNKLRVLRNETTKEGKKLSREDFLEKGEYMIEKLDALHC